MNASTTERPGADRLWVLGVTLITASIGLMAHVLLELPAIPIGIAMAVVFFGSTMLAPGKPNTGTWRLLPPLVLIPVLLFATWYFITVKFGQFGLGPILFHMEYGVEADGLVSSFFLGAAPQLAIIAALVIGIWLVSIADYRFRRFDCLAVLPLLAFNPFSMAVVEYVGDAKASSEQLLYHRYVDTAGLARPPSQPNLIHILLESSERTLYNPEFQDVLAPFDRFAGRGLQLTNVQEAALTNWSLAGDVANNCGVPLMPLGLMHKNNFHFVEDGFMARANCLGDLLSRDGYDTAVMHTSPLQFAGADKFYGSHGWNSLIGLPELRPHYPTGGNEWGLDDEDLYDAVYRRALARSRAGKPFAITMANIGGHAPHGFVSRSCRGRPSIEAIADPILKAYRCTHELAAEMLDRLDADGVLDNTVVIVQSDHLAMRNTIYSQLQRHKRRNLFFAFGPGIGPQTIDRDMTMMDIYPTILDLLGYAPENGHAGVGVSAFADDPTLIEELGLPALDKAIFADSELRNRLWGIAPAS